MWGLSKPTFRFVKLIQCNRASVDAVDMKNGEVVRAHTSKPTHVFVSVDDQMY